MKREPPEKAEVLPELSLPRDRVMWLAAHAPLLALALVLSTLALLLALASMAQVQQRIVMRGLVTRSPPPGIDGALLPDDAQAVAVDVSGANSHELQPGRAAVIAGNQGAALQGWITGVADLPGGCGGAVPCRRVHLQLDGVRHAGITEGEVEVRLSVASRSMLTWLLESSSR